MITYDVYCSRKGNTSPNYIGRSEDYLKAIEIRDKYIEKLNLSFVEECVVCSESKIVKNYNFYG